MIRRNWSGLPRILSQLATPEAGATWVRSCGAALGRHVAALLGRDLLATALDGLVALLCLHVLELVDEGELLLLGCEVG
jgi:hypothetical protein